MQTTGYTKEQETQIPGTQKETLCTNFMWIFFVVNEKKLYLSGHYITHSLPGTVTLLLKYCLRCGHCKHTVNFSKRKKERLKHSGTESFRVPL